MSKALHEMAKYDIGLAPKALNNANATGRYYDMSKFRTLLVILTAAAMAAAKTIKVELLQATDAAGSDSKAIDHAEATVTANALVTALTIDTTTGAATNTVTINGVVFTQAAATDASKREFADAAGLVTCINDDTYGVEGVSASANGAVVTCVSDDPGEVVITASGHANFTIATTEAQAYVEITASDLDLANGFTHVAAKVTTTANTVASAAMIRGSARFMPSQAVGASAML